MKLVEGENVMDADQRLIPIVEDDQGEGVMDSIPDELAQKLQELEIMKREPKTSEEMLANLQDEEEKSIPWLPELGTTFILGEREYKVTYINQGKYRFSCEPTDKGYLK